MLIYWQHFREKLQAELMIILSVECVGSGLNR